MVTPKDAILRDQLAIERTKLANQRTFLSYLRTAIMIVVTGITLVGVFPLDTWIKILGMSLVPIGVLTGFIGIANYLVENRKLGAAYNHE